MPAFNAYKFIAAAISTDATRYFMTYAYYDKEANALVATDGRRVHIWDNPPYNFPESTYVNIDIKNMKVYPIKVEGQFPAWGKVIPKDSTLGERKLFSFLSYEMSIPTFMVRYGGAFQYTFLKDLQLAEWTFRPALVGSGQRVLPHAWLFTRDQFRAVIMPMDHTKDD